MNSNALFDLAELRTEQERDASVAAASMAIRAAGSLDCIACENEISIERRTALPSATRCIDCQTLFEESRLRRRA